MTTRATPVPDRQPIVPTPDGIASGDGSLGRLGRWAATHRKHTAAA